MKTKIQSFISYGAFFCLIILISGKYVDIPKGYNGIPFTDSLHKVAPQVLPGILECELYDVGGEGVTFHDTDGSNSGSGSFNPANGSYLNQFRMKESVDISYTKFDNKGIRIDDSPFNLVEPKKNQLYVGWTEKGEWLKYTVNVKRKGTYKVGLMYTANKNGTISLSVNDKDATGPVTVPTTFVAKDNVGWRQWHHWNYIDNLTEVKLKKGVQVITLHTVAVGGMNYDRLVFELKK